MFVRVRFAKYGAIKYLGHLDVMRYFQKALRRSGVDVAYTNGYHPHQIMSFAQPLGVGVTSDGEYMDIELNSAPEKSELLKCLNSAMTDGFEVIDLALLGEREENKHHDNSMSLVSIADYYISVIGNRDYPFASKEAFEQKFLEFLDSPEIVVCKKTKTSEKDIDIKPYIYKASFDYSSFALSDANETAHAEDGDLFGFYLRLSSGSVMNIKPQLVLEAFCSFAGIEYNRYDYHLHRMNMYSGTKDEPVSLLQ